MTQSLLLRHVDVIYKLVDAPMSHPPGMGPFAVALLGPNVFDVPTGPLPRGMTAQLVKHAGRWGIRAFEACPRPELALGVARALSRWYQGQFTPDAPFDLEEFATHLLLPDDAVLFAVDSLGHDPSEFARAYCVPERIAAVRIREACAPDKSGSYSRIELSTTG